MGSLSGIPDGALVLVDSAPIIYVLEGHPSLGPVFTPLFERQARGELSLAISTVTLAEVLAGPLAAGEEVLARRYRDVLASWQVVDLTASIAEAAARLRAAHRLKLPDAVQAASALAIGADALVTHDRDFARLKGLNIVLG